MTKEEVKQQYKNEALNKIRKIFHPLCKFSYDQWSDRSSSEQIYDEIEYIIEQLEKVLNE